MNKLLRFLLCLDCLVMLLFFVKLGHSELTVEGNQVAFRSNKVSPQSLES